MSAVRSRKQDWWIDDDAPTQAVPTRGARGGGGRGGQGATVPLHAVARDVPRLARNQLRQEPRYEEPRYEEYEREGRGVAPPFPGLALPDPSKLLTTALLVGALALLLYLGITSLIDWTRVKLDDMHYGRPRTAQIDAWVGHNETAGTPSHFVAMNLNRRVTILEFPGGDVTKPQVIAGPYLFGRAEDLTVVKLRAGDVNGDDKPDLTVQVKDERLVYINDGAAFRPITAEELAQLQQRELQGQPQKDKKGGR